MAEQPAHPRASLVADDLVDLARKRLEDRAFPLAFVYTHDDGTTEDRPTITTDGLPAALPYALLELLVEIRDSLAGEPGIPRIPHVATEERRPVLAPRLGERDLDVLGDRIALAAGTIGWLDAGRVSIVAGAIEDAVVRYLKEKGIVA